jgi:hypothetical protein
MSFIPLQTERLTLRPCTLADIPALVPLIAAREVAAISLRIPHPYTESLVRDPMQPRGATGLSCFHHGPGSSPDHRATQVV